MYSAVEAFFHRIVDYAGMFPPARLDLAEAVRRYQRYRSGPEAWMLGRFVIPAGRLGELTPHLDRPADAGVMPLSVIVRTSHLQEDNRLISGFARDRTDAVDVSTAECRLPDGATDRRSAAAFLDDFDRAAGHDLERAFFELPDSGAGTETVSQICGAIAAYNRSDRRWKGRAGVKFRCGGPAAADVPGARFVADVIAACTEHGLPYKATAGLHHPVRHRDDALNTEVFGFLNVFGAGILAAVHRLPAEALLPVLLEDDPSNFDFGPGHFSWGDYTASVSWIRGAREKAILSFGSCSFEEPVQDLKELRLI